MVNDSSIVIDVLLVMRGLTLAGRLGLVVTLVYVMHVRRQEMAQSIRGSWGVITGQQGVLALTTLLVEAIWVLRIAMPDSQLVAAGRSLYNPAYLLNATTTAVAPFLIVAVLADSGSRRRVTLVVAVTIIVLAALSGFTGAVWDWGMLMTWSQVFAFIEVCGYLAFWGFVLLGHIRTSNAYLLGMIAVASLFTMLLPIQAEFFELVGRAQAAEIWHLHEFLQLALVATQLAVMLAYINSFRGSRRNGAHVRIISAGG